MSSALTTEIPNFLESFWKLTRRGHHPHWDWDWTPVTAVVKDRSGVWLFFATDIFTTNDWVTEISISINDNVAKRDRSSSVNEEDAAVASIRTIALVESIPICTGTNDVIFHCPFG